MSTKFLKRLSDKEILEIIKIGEYKFIDIEEIIRSEDYFVIVDIDDIEYEISDFEGDFFENDFWVALLFRKFRSEYANAYLEFIAKGYGV